jgi:hypothetical protein
MTRLWDKGASLGEHVLDYTAGDDHALDNRLVRYDIRASLAHAEMLGEQQLLSCRDSRGADRHRRRTCGRAVERFLGTGRLPDGDRESVDGARRRGRRPAARRPFTQ